MTEHHLFTEDEAAAYLRVRPNTLSHWRSTGRYGLPYVRVGNRVRYRRPDLDRWLETREVGSVPCGEDSRA